MAKLTHTVYHDNNNKINYNKAHILTKREWKKKVLHHRGECQPCFKKKKKNVIHSTSSFFHM